MKALKQLLSIGAVLFVIICLFDTMFWSSQSRFGIDNLLFPFALVYTGVVCWERKNWRLLMLFFLVMVGWILISDILNHDTFRVRSIGMSMRWIKWGAVVFVVGNLPTAWFSSIKLGNFVKGLFLIFVGINLIMYLNPFGLGEQLSYFYAPKEEVILGNYHEFGGFRLAGTMLNPNNNSIAFCLFLLYFLSLNAKENWKYIVLCFLLVFLTQSRTGMIASLLLIVFHLLKTNTLRRNLFIIVGGVLSLVSALFFFRSTNLLSLITGEAFKSNSWLERVEHYSIFYESSMFKQMIGRGILLNPLENVGFYLDSEYLSILLQYGYIGFILWITVMVSILVLIKKETGKLDFGWQLILLFLVFSTTNTVFLNPEITVVMAFLLGVWLFSKGNNKIEDKSNKNT
ncbi:MAG: O-antigen ligase family protein [Crocinitomicaceae bacterium]|nr:O-antigen ligase family protein [Crocinitomicaceae bacterium]